MPSAVFLVPGPLTAKSGGSIYDRRMVEGLRALGWQVDVHELDTSFPEPTAAALAHAATTLSSLPDNEVVVVDGLAFGAMADLVEPHRTRLNLVALVHMLLASEIGVSATAAAERQRAEIRALGFARVVVVTGSTTAKTLAAMGYRGAEPRVVEPGCDPAPLARGSGHATPHLLCVAAITAGKGHEALIRALDRTQAPWTLECVGSLRRDPTTAAKVVGLIEDLSLRDRVALPGELTQDALAAGYDRADVFVLNTRRETYAMAVSEALARGLPVISTRTGAIPELVAADAGILVEPGDDTALEAALGTILTDERARSCCRAGAMRARERLQPWRGVVARMADILASISGHA
jgi:glycosyltransferase involved in cell wall biosynthesis